MEEDIQNYSSIVMFRGTPCKCYLAFITIGTNLSLLASTAKLIWACSQNLVFKYRSTIQQIYIYVYCGTVQIYIYYVYCGFLMAESMFPLCIAGFFP